MKRGLKIMVSVLLCGILLTESVPFAKGQNPYELNLDTKDITGEYSVVYSSPSPAALYSYSPAIYLTSSGRMIVSFDLGGEGTKTYVPMGYSEAPGWSSVGKIAYSDDGGKTFTEVFEAPFLFGRPFEAGGVLYLIARDSENYKLVIYASHDNGLTWGSANYLDSRTWHSSPTPVLYVGDYLYMTMEVLSAAAAQKGSKGRAVLAPILMKAKVTDDLTNPASWSFSEELAFSDLIPDAFNDMDYTGIPYMKFGLMNVGWLEGNIFQIYDPSHEWYDPTMKTFYCYLRGSTTGSGYAGLMKFTEQDGVMIPSVVKAPSGKSQVYIPMPGGCNKFNIKYDSVSGLYWLVSSQNLDSTRSAEYISSQRAGEPDNERSRLALYYSHNAVDWTYAGLVSHGGSEKEARNYASLTFDGNDLLVISRSGDENASTAHNNNLVTLHRISDFRSLSNETAKADETSVIYTEESSDIKSTSTYIADSGSVLSIVNSTAGSGKVFSTRNGDIYTEVLSADYTLGSIFSAENKLYLLGVNGTVLVAFVSEDDGESFSSPFVLDTTHRWQTPPGNATVKNGQLFLPATVLTDSFSTLRGYAETSGSVTTSGDSVILNGYGAVSFNEQFTVNDESSVSLTVSPKEVYTGNLNNFAVAVLDKKSYFGGAADTGSGFVVELRSFGSDYKNGFNFWYAPVTNGVAGTFTQISSASVLGDYGSADITVSCKKKLQKIGGVLCTWEVTVTNTVTSAVFKKYVPASEVPETLFQSSKANVSVGCRIGKVSKYIVSNPTFSRGTVTDFISIRGYNSTSTGSFSSANGVLTLSGYGALTADKEFTVKEGTNISLSVSPDVLFESSYNNFAVGLTDKNGSFFGGSADTGYGLFAELRSVYTSYTTGFNLWYTAASAGKATGFTQIGSKTVTASMANGTVNITFTKKSQTVSGVAYSWVITATNTLTGDIFTKLVPASQVPETLFKNRQAYLTAGCRSGAITTFFVSGISVSDGTVAARTSDVDLSLTSPLILYASASADLTSAASWKYSKTLPYYSLIEDSMWDSLLDFTGTPYRSVSNKDTGWGSASLVEINDFEDARYSAGSFLVYMQNVGLGAKTVSVLRASFNTGGQLEFSVVKVPSAQTELFVSFPGGNHQFEILYDSTSSLYWLAAAESTDTVKAAPDDSSKIVLYYSYNAYDWCYAGLLESGVTGDAYVSMAINGSDLLITAASDNDAKQYWVKGFRSLSEYKTPLTWTLLRGYQSTAGSFSYDDNMVTLNGYGAVRYDNAIPAENNTSVSVTLTPTALIQGGGNNFGIALVNNDSSFFSNAADTASGFAVEIQSKYDYTGGYTVGFSTITNGTASGFATIDGAVFGTDYSKAKVTVTFTKITKTENNVNYTWSVTVTDAVTNTSVTKYIPESAVPSTLFGGGAHLSAGCRNGKITGFLLSHPTVITVSGLPAQLTGKGDSVSLQLSEVFSVSGYGRPEYSTNIGRISDGVWSYSPDDTGITSVELSLTVAGIQRKTSFQVSSVGQMLYPIRGYSDTQGSISASDGVNLNGYGAAAYCFAIPVTTGASASFLISPKGLAGSTNNLFGIALLNGKNSFFAGAADKSSGLGVQLRSYFDYKNGGAVYYSGITNGAWTGTVGGTDYRIGNRNLEYDFSATGFYFTITKIDRTEDSVRYTWKISMQIANTNHIYTVLIPESMVPDSVFGDTAYLSFGYRKTVSYDITDIASVNVSRLSVSIPETGFLPSAGDLNSDGQCSVLDGVILKNILINKTDGTPYRGLSDVNGDCSTDIIDLLKLKDQL